MSKVWFKNVYAHTKPFLFVIFLQTTKAVNGIIVKSALNKGLNHYTFAVYRCVFAALFFAPFAFFLERQVRPKMTVSIFFNLILLGLLGPVLDMNLFYAGMKYTTATFATALANIIPAITFLMAWIFRLEKVKLKSLHSQGKIIGTLVTFGGAMIMALITGKTIQFPWTNHHFVDHKPTMSTQDQIKGSLMVIAGSFAWAGFVIVQTKTLKSYPAQLSLTTFICLMAILEGTMLTLVIEKANASIWSINWDIKLFAELYGGIVCSGLAFYISGLVIEERGPVFVTAFNPLGMVIVAIMGSLILAEKLNLGSVLGAVVIVVGLYLVIWGKSKDQNQQDHKSSLDDQLGDEMNTPKLKDNYANPSREICGNLESI